ncbi:MAG: 1-acyl-sn-glycerol-3-phosphate acyltransferase [Clostridia bacterium]|nr:1-acyl-sn-glycerol-3-phosphate acyltransferase [Clostridia bacterium]
MFRVLYLLFRTPLCLLLGVRVRGRENVPKGGFLLAANHTSMLDVVVLYGFLWRRIRFMAKKEIFKTKIGAWFFRKMGAFPVDRGGCDAAAVRKTMHLIESGEVVCIFPEGTRHSGEDPRDSAVHAGIGMMTYHTRTDVLPVFIKAKNNHVRFFRRTEVIIGKPIPASSLGFEKGGMAEYKRASEQIFDTICSLGEESGAEK